MKTKSLKYNALLNIFNTMLNLIFPMLTFPYVSRILSPSGIGITSFFSSIVSYGTLLASLGISTYGIRAVANVREDKKKLTKVTQELTLFNFFTSIVISILLLCSVIFVEKFSNNLTLLIVSCLSIIGSSLSLSWFYSGLEQYEYITKRSFWFKIMYLILVFIFVKSENDYINYYILSFFLVLTTCIVNIYHARLFISFKITQRLEYKKHLKPMFYLFASLLAVSIYTNLDSVMLGFISGDQSVGLYSVASKIKWLLLSLITSISAVLLPRLSFYSTKDNKEQFSKILKLSTSLILFVAIPMSVFLIFEAEDSIRLLSGSDYISATGAMQILMPILIISGFSNITGNQILIPKNKEKYFMLAVSAGAVINAILNLFLIPRYTIIGTSIATLVAELTQMGIQFYYSKKDLKGNIDFSNLLNIVFATLLSSISIYAFKLLNLSFSPFLNILINAIIFAIIYISYLIFVKDYLINYFINIMKSSVFGRKNNEN